MCGHRWCAATVSVNECPSNLIKTAHTSGIVRILYVENSAFLLGAIQNYRNGQQFSMFSNWKHIGSIIEIIVVRQSGLPISHVRIDVRLNRISELQLIHQHFIPTFEFVFFSLARSRPLLLFRTCFCRFASPVVLSDLMLPICFLKLCFSHTQKEKKTKFISFPAGSVRARLKMEDFLQSSQQRIF